MAGISAATGYWTRPHCFNVWSEKTNLRQLTAGLSRRFENKNALLLMPICWHSFRSEPGGFFFPTKTPVASCFGVTLCMLHSRS